MSKLFLSGAVVGRCDFPLIGSEGECTWFYFIFIFIFIFEREREREYMFLNIEKKKSLIKLQRLREKCGKNGRAFENFKGIMVLLS